MEDSAATGHAGRPLDHDIVMAPPGRWPELADPRFRSLLRHWAAARNAGGGPMAPRSAIDPTAIRECLPNVWIYQYLPDEDDFLCTLSGETVNEAWGGTLMGKRASVFMPAPMRERVPRLYRRMMTIPAIQVSRRRIVPPDGIAQSAERLIVPLARDDGSAYGVFGLTLYYLGTQPSFDDPRDMQGAVTLYDCAGLPHDLP